MNELLNLEVVTPAGLIYEAQIKSVLLPGKEGEFGVLPRHSSLVASLKEGIIDIQTKENSHELVAINSGHAKIDEDKITILAKNAVWVSGKADGELAQNIQKAKDLIEEISNDKAVAALCFSKLDGVR